MVGMSTQKLSKSTRSLDLREKIYSEAEHAMVMVKTIGNRSFDPIQLYTRAVSSVWRTPIV